MLVTSVNVPPSYISFDITLEYSKYYGGSSYYQLSSMYNTTLLKISIGQREWEKDSWYVMSSGNHRGIRISIDFAYGMSIGKSNF